MRKRESEWDWRNRSVFVVGDADQSIYSFRLADFTILLDFQQDFGDGLPDEHPHDGEAGGKLPLQGKHSQAANQLIANNTQRIDKILKPTRGR